jgi:hypothetical protein
MRVVAVKYTRALHSQAAASVCMVHKDKLATVGVGFFQRREFSGFWAERLFHGVCSA